MICQEEIRVVHWDKVLRLDEEWVRVTTQPPLTAGAGGEDQGWDPAEDRADEAPVAGGAGRGSRPGLDMSSGNQGGNYKTGEGLAGILWRMGQGLGGFISRLFWQMSSHADYDRF